MVSQARDLISRANSNPHQSTLSGLSVNNGGHHAPETASSSAHTGDMMKQLMQVQSDAPPCSDCGSLMIRAGACYKCPDCGTTSGCG